MKSKYAAAFEWIIAIFLIFLCLNVTYLSYGSLTPIAAHERSERTSYYGPSEVIDTIDFENAKVYLCRYKDWYSTSIVKRGHLLWATGGQSIGNQIDRAVPVNYSWGYTRVRDDLGINKLFGHVNDENITSIVLESETNQEKMEYTLDSDRMFIFCWKGQDVLYKFKFLRAYDNNGSIVYEKKLFE